MFDPKTFPARDVDGFVLREMLLHGCGLLDINHPHFDERYKSPRISSFLVYLYVCCLSSVYVSFFRLYSVCEGDLMGTVSELRTGKTIFSP